MLFIFIGGGSGIGKSEITKQLGNILENQGCTVVTISVDNYYKERPSYKPSEEYVRETNFDEPDALQLGKLRDDLQTLNMGKSIEQPIYDFTKQQATSKVTIDPTGTDVFVIEGLYALKLAQMMKGMNQYNIYVGPTMYFEMIHQRISRDTSGKRGKRTPEQIRKYECSKVGPGFFQHVANTSNCAHIWLTNRKDENLEKGLENCKSLALKAYDGLKHQLSLKKESSVEERKEDLINIGIAKLK